MEELSLMHLKDEGPGERRRLEPRGRPTGTEDLEDLVGEAQEQASEAQAGSGSEADRTGWGVVGRGALRREWRVLTLAGLEGSRLEAVGVGMTGRKDMESQKRRLVLSG